MAGHLGGGALQGALYGGSPVTAPLLGSAFAAPGSRQNFADEHTVYNLQGAREALIGPVASEVRPADPDAAAEEPGAFPWKGEGGGWAAQSLALKYVPGSLRATTLSLLVTIMGTGCLGVAFAMRTAGLALGVAILLGSAVATLFSLHQLAVAGDELRDHTYTSLAAHCGGRPLRRLAEALIILSLLGTVVTYNCAFGDLVAAFVDGLVDLGEGDSKAFFAVRGGVIGGVNLLVVMPLSLVRDLGKLRFSSLLAFLLTVVLAVLVVMQYLSFCWDIRAGNPTPAAVQAACVVRPGHQSNGKHAHVPLVEGPESVFGFALPIMLYAFTCHMYVPPLLSELRRPTLNRMHRVLRHGVFWATALNLLIGVFGFLTFLDRTPGNILLRPWAGAATPALLLAQLGTAAALVLVLPLAVTTLRRNVVDMCGADHSAARRVTLVAVTFLVLAPCAGAAVVATDITVVFSLIGSTINPLVCYVLPAVFYLNATPYYERRFSKFAAVVLALGITAASAYGLSVQVRWLLG